MGRDHGSPGNSPTRTAPNLATRRRRPDRIVLDLDLEEGDVDGARAPSQSRAIAETAGVSKRTVYNIYDGKEALFRAVLQEAIDTAEAFATASGDLAAQVHDSQDLAADLHDLAERQATAAADHPSPDHVTACARAGADALLRAYQA